MKEFYVTIEAKLLVVAEDEEFAGMLAVTAVKEPDPTVDSFAYEIKGVGVVGVAEV